MKKNYYDDFLKMQNENDCLKRQLQTREAKIERLQKALEFAVTLIPKEQIPTGCGNNVAPWLINKANERESE